ncbi:MAG: hypothetical protein SOY30_16160 [Eubacteriales bacterium]|nr:hypothetical protein [Eubacteriales bacterium]
MAAVLIMGVLTAAVLAWRCRREAAAEKRSIDRLALSSLRRDRHWKPRRKYTQAGARWKA